MKIDPNKILIPTGLVLGTVQAVVSFVAFYNKLDTLGTDNEWKFYFSLGGFLIFFWMWSLLITVVVGRWWHRRPQRH